MKAGLKPNRDRRPGGGAAAPRGRKFIFSCILGLMILLVTIGVCEITIRFLSPVETLHPRYKFSFEYGLALFEGTTMVHSRPGKYTFRYSVNSNGHRGPVHDPRPSPGEMTIVVLGDSYSFGIGVNDGQEFASQMERELGEDTRVVNLANPGWGLTQQIRRYMEYGRLFEPDLVILQFCANDPEDNLGYMVTTLPEEGSGEAFAFHTSDRQFGWIKRYLSGSIIQKSQTYNLFRNSIYVLFKDRAVREKESTMEERVGSVAKPRERFYGDLLERFAEVLAGDETDLLMISVNGQLADFSWLMERVEVMDASGRLDYVGVVPWFEHESDYGSPEGHLWGAKGHAILGTRLARYIRTMSFWTPVPLRGSVILDETSFPSATSSFTDTTALMIGSCGTRYGRISPISLRMSIAS